MEIEIEESQLSALAGDDLSILVPIVEDFKENASELISQMRVALGASSYKELRGFLHQLKGSSGSLGMKSLYEICLGMEAMSDEEITVGVIDDLKSHSQGATQLVLAFLAS